MVSKNPLFIDPALSNHDYGFFRVGGPGLANCLIIAGRAYMIARKYNLPLLQPTWMKFSLGPILRREHDKRVYQRLFRTSFLAALKKVLLSFLLPKYPESTFPETTKQGIIKIETLGNYFEELREQHAEVVKYFFSIIRAEILDQVPTSLSGCAAIHIRRGDYPVSMRTENSWYASVIDQIHAIFPNLKFLVFSDGDDKELKELLDKENVSRAFFGNALADIVGISRCSLVIGSDSTFSGMGCFLSQAPAIFPKTHFGEIHCRSENLLILASDEAIPEYFWRILKETITGKTDF